MIQYLDVRNMSRKQWLAYREGGIGGSELCASISGVLGDKGSKNSDPIKVHLNKIGEPVTDFKGNRLTKSGHYEEPSIAHLYEFWDHDNPDAEIMYDNEAIGKKLSHVRRVDCYITNDKWPWLFASLDRRILRNRRSRRAIAHGRGILECKNTTSMEKNRYTYGVNPDFYYQVYLYLMLTGWEYCDIGIRFDGNNYEVITLEPRKEIFEFIEHHSAIFWKNVLECRKIKLEYGIESYYGMPDYMQEERQREGIALLMSLEPELRGTESEAKFIREIIKPTEEYTKMEGTQELFEWAVHRYRANAAMATHKEDLTKANNEIIRLLSGTHEAIYELPEGGEGKITYKPDSRGISKIFVTAKMMKGKEDA